MKIYTVIAIAEDGVVNSHFATLDYFYFFKNIDLIGDGFEKLFIYCLEENRISNKNTSKSVECWQYWHLTETFNPDEIDRFKTTDSSKNSKIKTAGYWSLVAETGDYLNFFKIPESFEPEF